MLAAASSFAMPAKADAYIAVFGAGWTARLVALALRSRGLPVKLLEPFVDPDGLPRPFPASMYSPWADFCSSIGLNVAWRDFGGAVDRPFSERRVTDLTHRQALRYTGGAAVIYENDSQWTWSEPSQGYAALAVQIEKLLQKQGVARLPIATVKVEGGLLRRAKLVGVDDIRQNWLAILPKTNWRLFRAPQLGATAPLLGREENCRWWSNLGRDWCFIDGSSAQWPTFARLRSNGDATTQGAYFWGLAPCRGLQVLRLQSPATQPAALWFTDISTCVERLVRQHSD